TGKPGGDGKNYTPKTADSKGGTVHNLNHSAEAVLDIDGAVTTLKKVYHEIWKKKRGSASAEYTGNTVDYYIDGVPVKEKEYTAFVDSRIAGAEQLRVLSVVDGFLRELDWKERRKLLVELCGEVSDEDIIQSSEALRELPKFLAVPGGSGRRYSVDEYRSIAASRKRDINIQLNILPGRIDEASRAIPAEVQDEEKLREQLEEARSDQAALQGRRAMISGTAARQRLQSQIALLEGELAEGRSRHSAKEVRRLDGLHRELRGLEDDMQEVRRACAETERERDRLTARSQELEAQREQLLRDYQEAHAQRWDKHMEACPTCGQALPPERVTALRAAFQERRSKTLEAISQKGKAECSKEAIDSLKQDAQRCQETLAGQQARLRDLEARRDSVSKRTAPAPYEDTEEYQTLQARLDDLRGLMERATPSGSEEMEQVNSQLAAVEERIRALSKALMDADLARQQRGRIAALEREEKTLNEEFERVEQGLYLCEQFIRQKVSMIDQRINGMFQTVRFKLFEEQVNGGLKDCCEALIPSPAGAMVAYGDANTAAKVNAGLEVLQTLAAHYGRQLPVFLDGAESVTTPIPVRQQFIRLVAARGENTLRLQTVESEES
ncbi:MAG: hypothetical protein LIO70_02280, partial [Clostridiales bacterium]|nr:hypothetical protein [Clostridiales bacterium]